MQYLLLIYGNESQFGKLPEAEHGKITQEYMDFTKSIAGSGHYKGGNGEMSWTVRPRPQLCGCATASDWSLTVPLRKPRSNSAATTLSKPKTLTTPLRSGRGFRRRGGARSR